MPAASWPASSATTAPGPADGAEQGDGDAVWMPRCCRARMSDGHYKMIGQAAADGSTRPRSAGAETDSWRSGSPKPTARMSKATRARTAFCVLRQLSAGCRPRRTSFTDACLAVTSTVDQPAPAPRVLDYGSQTTIECWPQSSGTLYHNLRTSQRPRYQRDVTNAPAQCEFRVPTKHHRTH